MSKEAMKLALEALEYIEHNYMSLPAPAEKAIATLEAELAKPDFWEGYEPEPVKPAQRKPLTDEEIDRLYRENNDTPGFNFSGFARRFARAIEAAHGIKENA